MADLATAFINLMTDTLAGEFVASGGDFTVRLTSAISWIQDVTMANPTRRGVVWFPPGVYLVKTGRTLPANVTLAFAPGALLVPVIPDSASPTRPSEDFVLLIAGTIDAEPRQIFATHATLPSNNMAASINLGSIVLTGVGNSRVFPEWWGASRNGPGEEPAVDATAIQAAIRAAIVDRERFLPAPLPPIEVYFGGRYTVDREILVIGTSRDPSAILRPVRAVVLGGASTPGAAATIKISPSFPDAPSDSAILRLVRVQNLLLRGISFDGQGVVSHCVHVENSLEQDSGVDHQITLDGCSWINAQQSEVTFRDVSTSQPTRGSNLVAVRRCYFGGVERRLLDPRTVLDAPHVAISFIAAYSSGLDVEGCVFEGITYRAVQAQGGTVKIFGCRFEITEPSYVPFNCATDVELTEARVLEQRSASLVATGCVSGSPSFLRVVPRSLVPLSQSTPPLQVTFNPPWAAWSPPPEATTVVVPGVSRPAEVSLTSVVHHWAPANGGSYTPPSVIWEDLNPDSLVARLVGEDEARMSLIGCRFVQAVSSSGFLQAVPFPRVFVSLYLKRVYNVGTFRRESEGVFAFLTFYYPSDPVVRSLGPSRSMNGPAPILRMLPTGAELDAARPMYAWATWLFR